MTTHIETQAVMQNKTGGTGGGTIIHHKIILFKINKLMPLNAAHKPAF